jgi:hypothetical protein
MDRDSVWNWLAEYEVAWRTAGTAALSKLFTPDAAYLQGPYEAPVLGLPAIAEMWDDGRDGPEEVFAMTSDIVAIDGNTAVVRVEVKYGDPVTQEYRDLWVFVLADDGKCKAFEEWPFWPGQPYTAADSDTSASEK